MYPICVNIYSIQYSFVFTNAGFNFWNCNSKRLESKHEEIDISSYTGKLQKILDTKKTS